MDFGQPWIQLDIKYCKETHNFNPRELPQNLILSCSTFKNLQKNHTRSYITLTNKVIQTFDKQDHFISPYTYMYKDIYFHLFCNFINK